MSEARQSHGVSLPSLWQVLILVVGSCAGWLVWSQMHTATPDPAASSLIARLDKLRTIERIADGGPEAVTNLVEFLSDAHASTRGNALLALGRIGPPASEALDQIRKRLTDQDPQVRMYALTAFWRVGRDPDTAADLAAQLLADPDAAVREDAAAFLESMGPRAIDAVSGVLSGEFAPAKVLALQLLRLWEWDDESPAVPAAVRRLEDDPDPVVRSETLATIAACDRPTIAEIRELMRANVPVIIRNPRAASHRSSVTSIGVALAAIRKLGPEAAELLPDVLDLLDDDGERSSLEVRVAPGLPGRVMSALRAMKAAAGPAIPLLLERFERSRSNLRPGQPLRLDIIETLIEIGADAGEITPILVRLLDDGPHGECREVAILLSRVNPPEAARIGSRIIDALQDDSNPADKRAVYTLEGLATSAALDVPVLIRLVDDSNGFVAAAAVTGLGEIGATAAPAVPALVTRLQRRSNTALETGGRRRMMIAETLGKIGPPAKSAILALIQMSTEPKVERRYTGPSAPEFQMDPTGGPQYREAAIQALGRIGAGIPEVFVSVQTQLADESPNVRIAAIRALPSLSARSGEVVDELVKQLGDKEPFVRTHTALAISRVNGDRSAAIPVLTSALSDDNPYVRSAAAATLGRIGPDAKSAVPALQRMLHEPGNWVRNSRYWPVGERYPAVSFYVRELADISIREAARSALAQIEE